jgi:hypothetical protein
VLISRKLLHAIVASAVVILVVFISDGMDLDGVSFWTWLLSIGGGYALVVILFSLTDVSTRASFEGVPVPLNDCLAPVFYYCIIHGGGVSVIAALVNILLEVFGYYGQGLICGVWFIAAVIAFVLWGTMGPPPQLDKK